MERVGDMDYVKEAWKGKGTKRGKEMPKSWTKFTGG